MGIAGMASAMDVTLAWDANTETNLDGYKIYYSLNQGGPYKGSGSAEGASPILVSLNSLSNPSSPEFTIHGISEERYYFVVTAFNSEGLESGYSNEVYTEPSTPSALNGEPVLSSLEVNGKSGSTIVYTNGRNVVVRMVAADDALVSEYIILDGKSDPAGEAFLPIPGGAKQNPIVTVNDFLLKDLDGSHTIYAWVKDDQGLLSGPASKADVILDRLGPTVAMSYSKSNPVKPGDTLTITANFTDAAPISDIPRISIDYAGIGNDLSGAEMSEVTNKQWTYTTIIPSGNDGKAIVTIAATDAAGNPAAGYSDNNFEVYGGNSTPATPTPSNPGSSSKDEPTPSDPGSSSADQPSMPDSDGDGIPDAYEELNGLDPVDASDRDLDTDQDGWTNYEEYLSGTAANDPGSHPDAWNDIEVIGVIPVNNAGISPQEKGVQSNTGFSVCIDSVNGIDMSDPNSITLTVKDENSTYTRKLNELNEMNQKLVNWVPLDCDGNISYILWAVYYRSNETAFPKIYPPGSVVEVTINVKDRIGVVMEPLTFRFRIQSEQEKSAEAALLPETSTSIDNTGSKKTITVESGSLMGASIIFPSTFLEETGVEPYFGPVETIPPLSGVKPVGSPLNLLPDMVFPAPVTLVIPCPGYDDVGKLQIYYYDGQNWWVACDSQGNVTNDGEGWMVPGSRVNHNNVEGSGYIEIQVYHFSAVAAAGSSASEGLFVKGDGGGPCFISSLWR